MVSSRIPRKERRAVQKEQRKFLKHLTDVLMLVPRNEWPDISETEAKFPEHDMPIKVWRSRHYLVQLYVEDNPAYPGLQRLSVCRANVGVDGHYADKIAWDELQDIKRALGYGNAYAIEIYPPDSRIINLANFRHLWILPQPLKIGW